MQIRTNWLNINHEFNLGISMYQGVAHNSLTDEEAPVDIITLGLFCFEVHFIWMQ